MIELSKKYFRLMHRERQHVTVRQEWQYGTIRWYGTPPFLLRSTVRLFCNGTGAIRWYGRTVRLFCDGTGTVRWYAV